MQLVIHDLSPEEWEIISPEYPGADIVTDNGQIHPCTGCFCCWHKTPGRCVFRDGYSRMGARIHTADEVVVISRYTYGGFSGFVKNVFDRSLGYVLPQLEVVDGESHHKRRYDEDKPFTFIFIGQDLSEEEKESALRYVTAVCTNIRGHVKEVIFRECAGAAEPQHAPAPEDTAEPQHAPAPEDNAEPQQAPAPRDNAAPPVIPPGKVLLLNGSRRYANGNSEKFAAKLKKGLTRRVERAVLFKNPETAMKAFEEATDVILCVPLYVDGLPAQVIRFMENVRETYRGAPKRIYVLANMGLYESSQLVNLFDAVRQWCKIMQFEYSGGLGVSAGELFGALIANAPWGVGLTKNLAAGMRRLAAAINTAGKTDDILAEPHLFPRSLYLAIANTNWNTLAKKNGIRPKDLYRRDRTL